MRRDLPAHTSASQLACYARCPRQYRFKYLDGLVPDVRSPNLALGTAVHGAVSWWFEARKAGHEPTRDDALRTLRADLGAALAAPEYRVEDDARAALYVEAERLVALFLDHLSELEIVAVEERFEVHLIHPDTGEVLSRPLVGFLDLVTTTGEILELKTAARAYSTADTTTNLQFAAYRYVAREQQRPDVRVVSLIKTKTPRVQNLALGPATGGAADWFVRVAYDIEAAIEARVFPPAPSAMVCATCDFKSACFGASIAVVDAEAA